MVRGLVQSSACSAAAAARQESGMLVTGTAHVSLGAVVSERRRAVFVVSGGEWLSCVESVVVEMFTYS